MAILTYSSRREIEEHKFHPLVTVLVPFAALFLQVYLPKLVPQLSLLDLPLIVVIFFSIARRSPIAGTLTGALVGLVQDAFTGQPIGINGICKSLIGYTAASIGIRVDVENPATRLLLNFGFSFVQSLLYFAILRSLLGMEAHWLWRHELLRAVANTVVAVPIFYLLDRAVLRDA